MVFSFILLAFYCLILVETRYLWPIVTPILIVIVATLSSKSKPLLLAYIIVSVILFSKTYFLKLPPDKNSLLHKELSAYIQRPRILLSDEWQRGLYIAFWSGCKYYGVTAAKSVANYHKTIVNEVNEGKVTHFISFDSARYDGINELSKISSWPFAGKIVSLFKTK